MTTTTNASLSDRDAFNARCDELADSYVLSAEHCERMATIYTGEQRERALMQAAEFRMKAELALGFRED